MVLVYTINMEVNMAKDKKKKSKSSKSKYVVDVGRVTKDSDLDEFFKGSQKMLQIKDGQQKSVIILDNPKDWILFKAHNINKSSVPHIQGKCHPCAKGNNASPRALINMYDMATKTVKLFNASGDVTSSLRSKVKTYKTLIDRIYSVSREGSTTDTKYSFDRLDREVSAKLFKKLRKQRLDGIKILEDWVKRWYDNLKEEDEEEIEEDFEDLEDFDEDDLDLEDDEDEDEDEEEEDDEDDEDEDDEEDEDIDLDDDDLDEDEVTLPKKTKKTSKKTSKKTKKKRGK